MEFKYTNRGPLPWAIQRTNVIRLTWQGESLVYSRHYVKQDGTFDDDGISHTFDNPASVHAVARAIHWGCCGWDSNTLHHLESLIEGVVLSRKPAYHTLPHPSAQ